MEDFWSRNAEDDLSCGLARLTRSYYCMEPKNGEVVVLSAVPLQCSRGLGIFEVGVNISNAGKFSHICLGLASAHDQKICAGTLVF